MLRMSWVSWEKVNKPITDIYRYWNKLRNEVGVEKVKMKE